MTVKTRRSREMEVTVVVKNTGIGLKDVRNVVKVLKLCRKA
jgi:hypothetical protein